MLPKSDKGYYAIGGVTYSETLIQGTAAQACSSSPAVFVVMMKQSLCIKMYTFPGVYEIADWTGRFTEVTAVRYQSPWMAAYSPPNYGVLAVFRYKDLDGNERKEGNSLVFFDSNLDLPHQVLPINVEPPHQNTLIFYSFHRHTSTDGRIQVYQSRWAIQQYVYYASPEQTDFSFNFYRGPNHRTDKLVPSSASYSFHGAFGVSNIFWYDNMHIVTGTVREKANDVGFFPYIYNSNHSMGYIKRPANDPPYYDVDLIQQQSSNAYAVGLPRDANYNLLQSTHPLIVFQIFLSAQQYLYCNSTGQYYMLLAVMLRFDSTEDPFYMIPLAFVPHGIYQGQLVFLKSSTGTDPMTLAGTEQSHIAQVVLPFSQGCSRYSVFIRTGAGGASLTYMTSEEQNLVYQSNLYFRTGRQCTTVGGIDPYCTLVGFQTYSNAIVINRYGLWVATASAYYYDGDKTGIFNEVDKTSSLVTRTHKFIMIVNQYKNTVTTNLQSPTYGSNYDWYGQTILPHDFQKTSDQTEQTRINFTPFSTCESISPTASAIQGQVLSGDYFIEIFTGDRSGTALKIKKMYTFGFSGCDGCEQCFQQYSAIVSTSRNTEVYKEAEYKPLNFPSKVELNADGEYELTFINGKDHWQEEKIYFHWEGIYSGNFTSSYIQKGAFSIRVISGTYYKYPACKDYCVSADELFENHVYEVDSVCKNLVYGTSVLCLENPESYCFPYFFQEVDCPTRLCTADDVLTLKSDHVKLEFEFHVQDLPLTFDLKLLEAINNPQNLKIASRHHAFIMEDGEQIQLQDRRWQQNLEITNTGVTFNHYQYQFFREMYKQEMAVAVQSTDCSTIDDSLHQAYTTPKKNRVMPYVYVPFVMTFHYCAPQEISFGSTESTFNIQKNFGPMTLMSYSGIVADIQYVYDYACFFHDMLILNMDILPFSESDPEYKLLKLDTWNMTQDIKLETDYEPENGDLQVTLNFKIEVSTPAKGKIDLQTAYKSVTITWGCFDETWIKVKIKEFDIEGVTGYSFEEEDRAEALALAEAEALDQEEAEENPQENSETETSEGCTIDCKRKLSSQPRTLLKIVGMPATNIDLTNKSTYIWSYQLDDLLFWYTDIELCHAYSIKMCADETCSSLSTQTQAFLTDNPTEMDAQGFIKPVLNADASDGQSQVIYFQGQTRKPEVSIIFSAIIIICGQEEVDMVEPKHPINFIYYTQEKPPSEVEEPIWIDFDVSTIFSVRSTNPMLDPKDCPIEAYYICSQLPCTGSNNLTSNERFIVNQNIVSVRYDLPMNKSQFYLAAETAAKNTNYLPITIEVCGDELLTTEGTIFMSLNLDEDDLIPHRYLLTDIFSNSRPECPIKSFVLQKNPVLVSEPISPLDRFNFELDAQYLTIIPSVPTQKSFYLLAITKSFQFASKRIVLDFVKNVVLPNSLPEYPSMLENVNITVSYDSNNRPLTEMDEYVYHSPIPEDFEEDNIFLEVLGLEDSKFMRLEVLEDFSLLLTISKWNITEEDTGSHMISVVITDDGQQIPNSNWVYPIEVYVTYFKEAKPLPPVQPPPTTFPGIDPAAVDAAVELAKQEAKKKNIVYPDPKVKFLPPTAEGKCILQFNQDMISPTNIIPSFYQKIFSFQIESIIDGSVVVGRIRKRGDSRKLQTEDEYDQEYGEQTEASKNLQFSVFIEEHSERQIIMQIEFEKPQFVSATNFGKDKLTIKFLNLGLFKSLKTLKPLASDAFEGGEPEVNIPMTPIITDIELAASIKGNAETGGSAVTLLQSGNFFLKIVLGGSMQQLWGMIRALQMIVLSALVQVNYPPHAIVFFQTCNVFAQMDILNGEDFYEENMDFKETEPLTEQFAQYNIESQNFFLNSGSYLILQILIILYYLGAWFINKFIARYRHKEEKWRRVAMYVYKEDYRHEIKQATLKLYMESYFDLAVCSILNFLALTKATDWNDFKEFFVGRDNLLNQVIGNICFVGLFGFLWKTIHVIHTHFGVLDRKEVRYHYEIYFEGARTSNYHSAQYNSYFLIRRLLTVFVLIFLNSSSFVQCQSLMLFSTINFIYIVSVSPLETRFANRVEVMNEACIVISQHMVNVFLNSSITIEQKNLVGWMLIGVACFNIVGNLGVTAYGTISERIHSYKVNARVNSYKRYYRELLTGRAQLAKSQPGKFKQFEQQLQVCQAVTHCKDWQPQRKWMEQNRIDFSEMEEEKLYQKYLKEHQMMERAQRLKLTEGVKYATVELVHQNKTEVQLEIRRQQYHDPTVQITKVERSKQLLRRKTVIGLEGMVQKSTPTPTPLNTIQEEEYITSDSSFSLSGSDKYVSDEEIQHMQVQQAKKLKESELLAGFKPQEQWFEFEDQFDIQQLEAIEKNYIEQQHPMPSNLQTIIENERRNFGLSKEQVEQQHRDFTLRKHNPFSLDFLVNEEEDDLQEYGEEILKRARQEDEEIVTNYIRNRGITWLKEGGKNDYLQALMQVLVEIQNFKLFFIRINNDPSFDARKKTMTLLIRDVFMGAYADRFHILQEVSQFNIGFLSTSMGGMEQDKAQDASKFFQSVCLQMKEELRSPDAPTFTQKMHEANVKKHKINFKLRNRGFTLSHADLFSKEFTMLLAQKYQCSKGHFYNQYKPKNFIYLTPLDTFEEALQEYFKITSRQGRCHKCQDKISKELRNRMEIRVLPPTIAFVVRLFDKHKNKKNIAWKIPSEIDFGKFLMPDNAKDVVAGYWKKMGMVHMYETFAILSIDGPNLEQSHYNALVKKHLHDKSKEQWFDFSALGFKEVEQQSALEDYRPQMIFFRKKPDSPDAILKTHQLI